jgi:toxin ParE1/3/4
MPFSVFLTGDASRDLEEIYDYINRNDVQGRADLVLERFDKAFDSLTENPHRGTFPSELAAMGIRQYRQLLLKPYRIIYRIVEDHVYVLIIADGRRDMRTLLQRRLLEQ